MSWIGFTLLAAFMQAVRTAGQKQLSRNLTAMSTTLSRYLFGLPVALLYTAALSLNVDTLLAAALTLSSMVLLQTVICGVWVSATETTPWQRLWQYRRLALFIGITSALGSIGWFTAMALHNPALVKTLGQVEFLVTLAITRWVFHERIHRYQGWGMVLVVVSVLLLLQ